MTTREAQDTVDPFGGEGEGSVSLGLTHEFFGVFLVEYPELVLEGPFEGGLDVAAQLLSAPAHGEDKGQAWIVLQQLAQKWLQSTCR